GELIVDNNGLNGSETPLRSVGSGIITDLTATVLTDDNAAFQVPDDMTGALGLIGLKLNPNIEQEKTFTIIGNTATSITIDSADGDMTEVAQAGDWYRGIYFFNSLTVRGKTILETTDDIFIASGGSLTVDDATVYANAILGGATELNSQGGIINLNETLTLDRATLDNESLILSGPLKANSLALLSGSLLTHSGATTETTSRLELEVGVLTVDGTSAIDVTGKGYLGGGRSATGDYGRTLGNVPGSYRGVSGSYGGLGKIGDPSYPAPDT
ncbi:hypothetical protein D1BOALGB6SA_7078, partial [Olavius sp. associated proteobacterium Delta 1]